MGNCGTAAKHRLLCGDSRRARDLPNWLMNGTRAAAVFTDPPYNLRVRSIGGRGKNRHPEFAFASGEMLPGQYRAFLTQTLGNGVRVSADGAVHYVCMDWRHIADLIEVGCGGLYGEMLNLAVWNKSNAGQGSFYRSQHELICVFRVGDQAHRNNVELGRFGRNRSNVWTYAGVNSFGSDRDETLATHPTVKPVALVADALLDCTRARRRRCSISSSGSGTTILAAEKIGRVAHRHRNMNHDTSTLSILSAGSNMTRLEAILAGDGRSFEDISGGSPVRKEITGIHAVQLQHLREACRRETWRPDGSGGTVALISTSDGAQWRSGRPP